jgi:hypothetical protein
MIILHELDGSYRMGKMLYAGQIAEPRTSGEILDL